MVEWTENARNDLFFIYDYIAKDNSNAAKNLIDSLLKAGDNLLNYPQLGRMIPEYEDPDLREIIYEKKYRIMYRLLDKEGKNIHIIHVRNTRQKV